MALTFTNAAEVKPIQGVECVLVLANGQVHAGHWLEHANKYQRNTRRWKIYKWNKYVDEDEVVAWAYMAGGGEQ